LTGTTQWLPAPHESQQLMQICLKKIRGLSDAKLIDSKFKWTEPNSQRINLIIEIQREALKGVYLQRKIGIAYKIVGLQCDDC